MSSALLLKYLESVCCVILEAAILASAIVPDVIKLADILSNIAKSPSCKLTLAADALDAPVPPLAIAKSVPDQFELLTEDNPPLPPI